MKKLLFTLLLVPMLLVAQNRPDWDYDFQQPISVDFPNKLPFYNDYLPLQNTYYELNVTLNNVRKLVTDNLKMNPKENAPSGKGFQFEIYTNPTHRDALEVKYNTFTVYGLEVVKSIEINGGFADVAKLFIYMYNTNLSTNDTPVNQAKKYYKQDYAVFTVLPTGKASMVITNTEYANNTDQFIADFESKKAIFKSESKIKKLAQETARLEEENYLINRQIQFIKDSILRREQDKRDIIEFTERENAKSKTLVNVYYFTKKNKEIVFENDLPEDLQLSVYEKTDSLKKGRYSAYVTTTKDKENITYTVKINPTNKAF